MSDPALCDADQQPSDSVDRCFSWEAEVMESAALEVFGAVLMPRALLKAEGEWRTAGVGRGMLFSVAVSRSIPAEPSVR